MRMHPFKRKNNLNMGEKFTRCYSLQAPHSIRVPLKLHKNKNGSECLFITHWKPSQQHELDLRQYLITFYPHLVTLPHSSYTHTNTKQWRIITRRLPFSQNQFYAGSDLHPIKRLPHTTDLKSWWFLQAWSHLSQSLHVGGRQEGSQSLGEQNMKKRGGTYTP